MVKRHLSAGGRPGGSSQTEIRLAAGAVLGDVGSRALFDDAATFENIDLCGEIQGQGRVLFDQDHGQPPFLVDLTTEAGVE